MKNRLTHLLLSIVLVLLCSPTFAAEVDITRIRTNFVAQAILSPEELRTVIELAADCGVTNVDSVSTGYLHPTSDRFISVRSKETVVGRTVFASSASVYHDRWLHNANKGLAHWKTNAGFWIERHHVRTQELTVFSISNKTFRVQLDKRVEVPLADKIVEALWNGKTRYAMKGLEDLKGTRFISPSATPTSVGKTFGPPGVETYTMSFECTAGNGLCSKVYRFTFDGNEVTIIDFNTIQA